MSARKAIPVDVAAAAFHESGYKCANPNCHVLVVLQIHHIVRVADDGGNDLDNLLCLCPTCHSRHHNGEIPQASIRTWKRLLVTLNHAMDRRSIDLLIVLHKLGELAGLVYDSVIHFAPLIAAGLVECKFTDGGMRPDRTWGSHLSVKLSPKGVSFVDGWMAGDQSAALSVSPVPPRPPG